MLPLKKITGTGNLKGEYESSGKEQENLINKNSLILIYAVAENHYILS